MPASEGTDFTISYLSLFFSRDQLTVKYALFLFTSFLTIGFLSTTAYSPAKCML